MAKNNDYSSAESVPEKIKGFLSKPKDILLTPDKEKEIREDERVKFASSFNFQSLFVADEAPQDWLKWLPAVVIVLNLIIIAKVW